MSEEVPEAFAVVCAMAARLGLSNINELPGCWEHQVNADWWIALNGHEIEIATTEGTNVPPYSMFVKWNGWPAGVIDVGGGIIMYGSEDDFIAAVKGATRPLDG